jgi:eukaryotic-like serine/threonine-protein kinase
MVELLSHYRILYRMGRGQLGELYRGRDMKTGRSVALRILDPSISNDPDRRERLLADARKAVSLSHPNIASLFDAMEDEGRILLISEMVQGETLRASIGERALSPRRAVGLAIQIGDALAEAHSRGILQEDIGPDSIMVTQAGHAKLLDCGMASWTAGGAARRAAASDLAAGRFDARATPYLSPEQALGDFVDLRSDIFSLGIVLYEMLVGRPPFPDITSADNALAVLHAPVIPPSTINPRIPGTVDSVVLKALTRSLEGRYQSAAAMVADLRLAAESLESDAATVGVRAKPQRRLARYLAAVLLLFVMALTGWQWRDEAVERLRYLINLATQGR